MSDNVQAKIEVIDAIILLVNTMEKAVTAGNERAFDLFVPALVNMSNELERLRS